MDQSSIDTHREDYEHTEITEKHTCLQKHTSQDYASTLCYIHHGFLGKAEGISSNNNIMPRPNVIFPLPPLSVMQQHEQITHGSHRLSDASETAIRRNANAGFIQIYLQHTSSTKRKSLNENEMQSLEQFIVTKVCQASN